MKLDRVFPININYKNSATDLETQGSLHQGNSELMKNQLNLIPNSGFPSQQVMGLGQSLHNQSQKNSDPTIFGTD
jgi:hypothetical protein